MRHCPKVAALQLVCSLTVRRKASTSRWQAAGLTSTTVRRFKPLPPGLGHSPPQGVREKSYRAGENHEESFDCLHHNPSAGH